MDEVFNEELIRHIDEQNKLELEKPCSSVTDMLERVEYYALTGNMEQSRKWLITAKDNVRSDQERSEVLIIMARYEQDHAIASLCYEEASNLLSASHKNHSGILLFKAGTEAFYAKDYDRAIKLLQTASCLLADVTENQAYFFISLCSLGNCHFAKGEYEQAIEVLASLSEMYREAENLAEYHDTRCSIATNLKYLKRYDEAIPLLKEALYFYDSKELHLNYLSAKSELESCLAHAGYTLSTDDSFDNKNDLQAKIILERELANLEVTRKYLGIDQYAHSLGIISGSYQLMGDTERSLKYARLYVIVLRESVAKRFSFSSFSDRFQFWNSHKDYIHQIKSLISKEQFISGEAAALLYDIALLEKGILLCSSIELQRVIHESREAYLQDLYTQACKYETIRKKRTLTPEESLSYESVNLKLMNGCSELRDYTSYLKNTWKDVQSRLKDDDIAIEFITCPSDTTLHGENIIAITLKKNDDFPTVVPICDSGLIKRLIQMTDIDKQILPIDYYSFWGRLINRIEGSKKVYFSPEGPLCYFGIEFLNGPDGSLADQYEVHRISSTREIWRQTTLNQLQSAILFGGASYHSSGYSQLYYSMDEVIDIRSIMLESGIANVKLFTSNHLTKDALLNLSGKAPSCIHLAVHGDYTPSKDHPDGMKDSFLILSEGETVTAEEISGMDLYGCELVVLSSCFGSRGQLLDDGVFGLQRAFKNAGVKALLMSTGPINDEVTSKLMKSFYVGLMSGLSYHDAYDAARRAVNENRFPSGSLIQRFILLEH